jgi:hypothetical protein
MLVVRSREEDAAASRKNINTIRELPHTGMC